MTYDNVFKGFLTVSWLDPSGFLGEDIPQKMSGAPVLVHVTHVDDSVKGRQGPCLSFWGNLHDQKLFSHLEKSIEDLRPYLENSHPPYNQGVLVDQICCVLVNQKWQRARVTELKLNHPGSLEVFCIDSGASHIVPLSLVRTLNILGQEAEYIRECYPLATKFILADVVAPQGPGTRCQWSDSAITFLKIHMENRKWRAVYQGMCGNHQCVRLYDQNNQLLATTMIHQNLAIAAPTYHEALSSFEDQELISGLMKPNSSSFNVHPAEFDLQARVRNQPPPLLPIPTTYSKQNHSLTMTTSPSTRSSQYTPRAYIAALFPANGRHDIQVTTVLEGPFKFTIYLNEDGGKLKILRRRLNLINPVPFSPLATSPFGAPCLAIHPSDQLIHRGMITDIHPAGKFRIYFVDIGTSDVIDASQLYDIPDEFVNTRLYVSRVSLYGAEDIADLPGIEDIFKSLVASAERIQCEVAESSDKQKVNLYDQAGRSFRDILCSIHTNITNKMVTTIPSNTMQGSRPSSSFSNIMTPTCVSNVRLL